MSERPPEGQALAWVGVTLLIAMAGGVVTVLAEPLNRRALAVVGLIVFLAGIIATAASVVMVARRMEIPMRSAIWRGIKTAGSLLWQLAP